MRWLFVVVLAALVACIMSIAWLNDDSLWPTTSLRPPGGSPQPSDQNLLPTPAPGQ